MKTEKSYQVQLIAFPDTFIQEIKKYPDWEIIDITKEPDHPDSNNTFDILYNGMHVLYLSRWSGYGWDSQACYMTLRISIIDLLKTVIPNHIKIWNFEASESVVKENYYTEII